MTDWHIRPARTEDAAGIVRLAAQLGYPATLDVMQARLRLLLASANDAILVAADDGGLRGWIHGVLSQYLESDYRVEIAGLVVDKQFHRRGIGRELVKRIENWGHEHGAAQSSVRCRTERAEAHLFYKSLGYAENKTQVVFRKKLG